MSLGYLITSANDYPAGSIPESPPIGVRRTVGQRRNRRSAATSWTKEHHVGIFKGAMKTGLALKAFEIIKREAAKPQNQAKAKELLGKATRRRTTR